MRQSILNRLSQRSTIFYGALLLIVAAIVLFFVAFLTSINIASEPIADDYQFLYYIQTNDLWTSLSHYDIYLTGRYGNALVLILSIKLLGIHALQIVPLLSLLVLMICVAATLHSSANHFSALRSNPAKRLLFTSLGPLAIILSLITAPSIFDTYVWFSAATVYITSAAILAAALLVIVRSFSKPRISPFSYILTFILVWLAAGFYELIPITLAFTGLIGLVVTIPKLNLNLGKKIKPIRIYSLIFLTSSAFGTWLITSSTWAQNRIEAQQRPALREIIYTTFDHLHIILDFILSWRSLSAVLLGVLAYIIFGRIIKRSRVLWLLCIALGMLIVPTLIIALLASATGAIEPTGLGSNRILWVATSSIMLGVALLTYLALSLVRLRTHYLLIAVILLGLATTAAGTFSLSKVSQAVYVRKSMMQYREALIRHDLKTDSNTVRLMPAPMLLSNAQPYDLSFGGQERQVWLTDIIAAYYHIPEGKVIEVPLYPPAGYCAEFSRSPIYGRENCAEAVRHYSSDDTFLLERHLILR